MSGTRDGLHGVRAERIDAAGTRAIEDDWVVTEEPLEIRVAGDPIAVTMRTPGHDAELALGLLFSEAVIESRDDVGSVAHCGRPGDEGYGNTLEIAAAPGSRFDPDRLDRSRRGSTTTAACGVCGRRSIDDLLAEARPIDDKARFPSEVLRGLPERLRSEQRLFERTGGLHAAGLADESGKLSLVREDVGRHNAVDKLVGRLLLDRALPARGKVLIVSGRVSFEIVQKAVRAGFPALIAISAPSSLAIQTAQRAGLTLMGFCRGGVFNVYSGNPRVV